jgi:hypothetical protein
MPIVRISSLGGWPPIWGDLAERQQVAAGAELEVVADRGGREDRLDHGGVIRPWGR